jgi:hypothetical protein
MKAHRHVVRGAAALVAAAVIAPTASAHVQIFSDNSSLSRPSAASKYTPQALKALGERAKAQADAYVAAHSTAPAPIPENSAVFATPPAPAGVPAAPAASGDGFAWADAAIGAGVGAALAVLGLLGAISMRARGLAQA